MKNRRSGEIHPDSGCCARPCRIRAEGWGAVASEAGRDGVIGWREGDGGAERRGGICGLAVGVGVKGDETQTETKPRLTVSVLITGSFSGEGGRTLRVVDRLEGTVGIYAETLDSKHDCGPNEPCGHSLPNRESP